MFSSTCKTLEKNTYLMKKIEKKKTETPLPISDCCTNELIASYNNFTAIPVNWIITRHEKEMIIVRAFPQHSSWVKPT